MDLLNRIKMDIARVDKDIREIDEVMEMIPKDDLGTKSDLFALKSRYRNDKIKLLKSYHDANQDLSLRNEELRQRIEEIKARISLMASGEETSRSLEALLGMMDDAIEDSEADKDEQA